MHASLGSTGRINADERVTLLWTEHDTDYSGFMACGKLGVFFKKKTQRRQTGLTDSILGCI